MVLGAQGLEGMSYGLNSFQGLYTGLYRVGPQPHVGSCWPGLGK